MASGDLLLSLTPAHAVSPATNGATHDTRNGHPVLDFRPDTANEITIFPNLIMPPNYSDTTGVTVYYYYSMSTATSGDVDLDVEFERVADSIQDIDTDGFGAVTSLDNTTVPATSGLVDVISVAVTKGANMDSVVANDGFRLRVTRDGISDTAAGDLELWALKIFET